MSQQTEDEVPLIPTLSAPLPASAFISSVLPPSMISDQPSAAQLEGHAAARTSLPQYRFIHCIPCLTLLDPYQPLPISASGIGG
jgi:hypothetical protein